MAKHTVCLTFDFDGISGFIARGQRSASELSRGEFGPRVGAPRLLALLRRHGIRSTWFVPGHTIETFPWAVEAVVEAGHEIAHHGWTHRPPASLSRDEEAEELARGNEAIRRLTGWKARGYRSPSWDLSPHSVDLMLQHGFVYDSSMMGDDYTPYFARRGDAIELASPARLGAPSELVEMPIHWSTDDAPHFEHLRMPDFVRQGLRASRDVEANWLGDFLYMRRTLAWGVLTYTCHPFISGRGHRIMMLERLIRSLAGNGAEFRAMEDAVADFRARAARPDEAARSGA